MKIWANTIVHNEENYIWYSVMSIVDRVDKVLIWDTGSTDKTVEIVQEIIRRVGEKVIFKEVGEVDKFQYTKMRQQMLEQSDCDWIMILDGDEVWSNDSIDKIVAIINEKGARLNGIVVPFYSLLGDVYHFQEKLAGKYKLLGKTGHYSLRFLNKKISGLHVELPYGKEGYYDENNTIVHDLSEVVFVDAPYFHATHLQRSSKERKGNKYKYELGSHFAKDFQYPEVFFMDKPSVVINNLPTASLSFKLISGILTIPRRIKRLLFKNLLNI